MKIRDRIVEFRRVPAGELQPNPRNWRTHPKAQQEALRGVLAEIGYAGAALAFKTPEGGLMLIDGHLRAETTPEAMIPTLVTDLSREEADLLLASYDPLAAMAEADKGKLDALLKDVQTGSEALQGMLAELAKEQGLYATPEITEDEVPEPPVDPVTKAGDLWILGEHRLLCGDSTDAAAVDKLFAGGRASLLFTSPPYAQQREYTKESREKGLDWDSLMQGVFQHAERILEPDGQILVNLGLVHRDGEWLPYWDGWIAWMRERGWRRFGWYVWDQGPGLPGDWNGRFAPSHEFVFHFNRKPRRPEKTADCKHAGSKNHGSGLRSKEGHVNGCSNAGRDVQQKKVLDSVLRFVRHKARGIECKHPAVFAVPFAAAIIESWPGLVFEPFGGSGTTIVAAEQLGRRCYGIEISPAYCDVIVQRWEKLTGRKAVLENDKSKKCKSEEKRKRPATRRLQSAKR